MSHDLYFECQRGCTKCCERQGFVYLAETDVPRLAAYLKMEVSAFEQRYVYRKGKTIRLRAPHNAQCFFLTPEGCSVHAVKPVQCRAFPFWPELLESRQEWRKAATWCPGIGKGQLIQIQAAAAVAQEVQEAYPHYYGK